MLNFVYIYFIKLDITAENKQFIVNKVVEKIQNHSGNKECIAVKLVFIEGNSPAIAGEVKSIAEELGHHGNHVRKEMTTISCSQQEFYNCSILGKISGIVANEEYHKKYYYLKNDGFQNEIIKTLFGKQFFFQPNSVVDSVSSKNGFRSGFFKISHSNDTRASKLNPDPSALIQQQQQTTSNPITNYANKRSNPLAFLPKIQQQKRILTERLRMIKACAIDPNFFNSNSGTILNQLNTITLTRVYEEKSCSKGCIRDLLDFLRFCNDQVLPFLTKDHKLNGAIFVFSAYIFIDNKPRDSFFRKIICNVLIGLLKNSRPEFSAEWADACEVEKKYEQYEERVFAAALRVEWKNERMQKLLEEYANACYSDSVKKIKRNDLVATLKFESGSGGLSKLRRFIHFILISQDKLGKNIYKAYSERLGEQVEKLPPVSRNLEKGKSEGERFINRIHQFLLIFYARNFTLSGRFQSLLPQLVEVIGGCGFFYKSIEEEYIEVLKILKHHLVTDLKRLLETFLNDLCSTKPQRSVNINDTENYIKIIIINHREIMQKKYIYFSGKELGEEKITIALGKFRHTKTALEHLTIKGEEYSRRVVKCMVGNERILAQISPSPSNQISPNTSNMHASEMDAEELNLESSQIFNRIPSNSYS